MKIKARLPAVFIPKDHPLATSCVKAVEKVLNETPDVRHFHAQHNPSWGRPRWLLITHWLQVGGCGPANEGYMLIEKGIPTICGFGPKGGAPHAPNGTSCVVTYALASTVLLTCFTSTREQSGLK